MGDIDLRLELLDEAQRLLRDLAVDVVVVTGNNADHAVLGLVLPLAIAATPINSSELFVLVLEAVDVCRNSLAAKLIDKSVGGLFGAVFLLGRIARQARDH